MTHIATLLMSIALLAACACGPRKIPLESDVPFAMHQETREFVVDRSPAGGPATVTPASWVRLPGGPAWVLRRGTETRAAYWSDGNAGVTAREGLDPSSALHATVRPRWDEGDVRLRVEPAGGPAFDSDVFARLDGGGGTAALSRSAKTILDVRGRYQAALRDAAGAEVGWLRVRIGPYEPAARIYEASLPGGLDEATAVAAVLALGEELDWIEQHTVDVYQGDRGPLIQSVPIR